jgi:hypothetical protein
MIFAGSFAMRWLRRASVLLLLVVSACATTQGTATSSPSQSSSPSANAVPSSAYAMAGGCGATQLYKDGFPDWITRGVQGLTGMEGSVYAIASPTTAVGFLLEYPLKAKTPTGSPSKLMWLVSLPRNGSELNIEAHPLGSSTPVVHESRPANAGPGEIYPDGLSVPTAGCWHLTLSWSGNKAEIDLPYVD